MESNSRSDWDLLAAAAEGNAEAFRELVENHQGGLVRVCNGLLRDRDEALDAAQEVFLKAFRKAASLEPKGQLFTWLYRVAVNHCLNRLRRRKIVRFVQFEKRADEEPLFEPVDRSPNPERALVSKREWQVTRRAIDTLPPGQRVVLLLAKFEGLSYRRIAEVMGITVGAVEGRLFRAMRKLQAAQEDRARSVSPEG